MIANPIHIGTINGVPVRFFKTPLNAGRQNADNTLGCML